MKVCIICLSKKDYAPKRMHEELIRHGHEAYLMPWMDISLYLAKGVTYIGDGKYSLDYFDAIIPRSPQFSDKEKGKIVIKRLRGILNLIIQYAKERNLFVLNSKFFGEYQSEDKLAQQFFLFQHGLPGIDSGFFSRSLRADKKLMRFPLISKTVQGSLGKGVFKLNNKKELEKIILENNVSGRTMMFQKYCKIKSDFRVLVIDGKAIGVIERVAQGNEWRTNVSLGGFAKKVIGKKATKITELAEKVAKEMKFDYVGVDILEEKGKFFVIEVNSLAQFRGFESAFQEINVAEEVIKMVEKRVKRLKKQ
jgi:RimK family alpha-L-glutamate ligase